MKHFNFLLCLALFHLFSNNLNAQSLDFDGVDDYVNMPNATQYITSSFFGFTDITLSAWIKPEQTGVNQYICGIRQGDALNDFYFIQKANNEIEARFVNSTGTIFNIDYSPGLNQGEWNHLVMTYDGSILKLYHNTIEVASIAASGGISDDGGAFNMGAWNNSAFFYKGELDEVSLWNKVVTITEMQDLYNKNPDTSDSDLQLYYKFNQGTPNGTNTGLITLIDNQGNQNGFLGNFALSGTTSNWVDESNPDLVVTNTNTTGFGSLRAAVDYANNTAGAQTINFDIPGTGPHTIINSGGNYNLTDDGTIIDARTQPGYVDTPIIFLDGENAQFTCFSSTAADIEIYGFNIQNNTQSGVILNPGSESNIIHDNIITNYGSSGILISANSTNSTIQYNQIGIDENGLGTATSSAAIWLQAGATGTLISYNTVGTGTADNYALITLFSTAGNSNTIRYNNIGTDGNGGDYGAPIGLKIDTDENVVSNNIIANNGTGIDDNGQNNDIYRNDYFCNSVTAMESNGDVLAPIILTATVDGLSGTATYSAAGSDYIHIHKQDASDCPGSPCQGEYITGVTVQPDGTWSYNATLVPGIVYTAHLNFSDGTNYETSELSACITVTCSSTTAQGDSPSDPIIIGEVENYTDLNNSACYTNTLGNTSKDVIYQFTTLSCVDSVFISTCEGSEINTVLRLFDNTGTQIELNNDACGTQSEINRTDLNPGEDYIIAVEGGAGESGLYTLNFRQTTTAENINYDPTAIGNGLSNPYPITIPYSGTDNTKCYTDSIGNTSPDVFYQFTLGECIDYVAISTCNSAFDTYLRLLDADGNEIDADDDDAENGPGCGDNTSLIETTALVTGETYVIVVEGYSSNEGAFTLDIETFSSDAAPGDSLSTAIVIPSLPFTTTDSTDNPCLSDNFVFVNAGTDDIYYQFTPSVCATSVTISMSNSSMDYYILDAEGTVIVYENQGGSSLVTDQLTGGEIYYLVVEAFEPGQEGTFTLGINETVEDGSTGNDIASAIVLTEGTVENNTSCGYTSTIGNVTPDVFYQFTTGSCTDSIILSTCEETSFNTLIRLLDENEAQIDINYNACGLQSEIIRTDLEPNTTYYAVVEGQNGESGIFSLNYRETLLAENISNGSALGNTIGNPFIVPSLPFSANGNTDDCLYSATLNNPGDEGGAYVDHFYQFTTNACPSEYTISTCGLTAFDTYIFLKDAAGTVIEENNDACGNSSIISRSDLSPNTTYLVEIEGLNPSDIGNYNLSISSVAIGPNTIVYVDQTASGNNDGTTWTDAYTDLQDALANMTDCGNEIWLAAGTYYTAAPGSGRGATFNLDKNVLIYGGFAGGETDLSSRDVANNLTELSGDIDDDGTSANNSFHTVKVDNATVILDGLTIKDGAANDTPFARARGGGLFVKEANLTLENCTIKDNVALFGGALFATLSDVTINGSTISNNEANYGAALYHSNENNMYINETRIVDNNSIIRCAVEVNNSNYTKIINTIIANNTAANANAIGIISTNRNVQCDIYNSTILGGTKNRALITLQVGFGDQLDMNVYNSIVAHQNLNFNKNFVAFNNNVLNLNTTNCYIQGASVIGTATNNLYSDTAGDLLLATDGSYALQACSPAVDAGSNSYLANDLDIVGNSRYNTPSSDMGAYESTEECVVTREVSEELLEMKDVEAAFLIQNIYPNPASDILNIAFNASGERDIYISITDLSGKLIMNQTIRSIGGEQVETLDVSRLTAGYYLVNLQNDGERISQKFVKM